MSTYNGQSERQKLQRHHGNLQIPHAYFREDKIHSLSVNCANIVYVVYANRYHPSSTFEMIVSTLFAVHHFSYCGAGLHKLQ